MFELVELAASDRSAGRLYADAAPWRLPGAPPPGVAGRIVKNADPASIEAPLVFSALDASVALEIEGAFARAGRAVISNARSYRMAPDVPLVVPEANADHLALVRAQRRQRGWSGFIATNPNCSVIALTLALAPLHRAARVRRVVVTTLQAASGAGYPGVSALDLIDNVIPEIGGEEDKLENEPQKILGALEGERLVPAALVVSSHTHRVPVQDGHLLAVSVETETPLAPADAAALMKAFRGMPQELALPSAPASPIVVVDAPHRPQPRLDRDEGNGMSAVVGRLRPCPVLGLRFEVLGHNTVRGAAGGTLLIAEQAARQGYVP